MRQRRWQQRYKLVAAAASSGAATLPRASTSKNSSSNNEVPSGDRRPEWPLAAASPQRRSQINSRLSDPFDIVQLNAAAKASAPGDRRRHQLEMDAQSTDSDYALGICRSYFLLKYIVVWNVVNECTYTYRI